MEGKKIADIIVIGGGPGGYVAAIRAAQLGAKVLLIEKDALGGTCLNRGCIPTKTMLADAKLYHQVRGSSVIKADGLRVDMEALVLRKDEVVKRLASGVQFLIQNRGVSFSQGKARVIDPKTVEVEGPAGRERFEGRKIIIATGSESTRIPNVSIDGKTILTSTEILNLSSIPKDLLVIGGGVIGIEFACLFNGFGSKVTVVEMLPTIIATEDEEVIRSFLILLKKRGIEVLTDTRVKEAGVKKEGAEILVIGKNGKEDILRAEKALIAVGRSPYTEGLGLDQICVAFEGKFVKVNERMETNLPGIYAIGDVTGRQMLAHKAQAEGLLAAEIALGHRGRVDYSKIPNCIYTFPEIASVGLTERQARERGLEVTVGRFSFQSNGRALASGNTDGFVKVVAEKDLGQVMGVHILGDHATDLIGGPVLGLALEATVEELGKTIQAHPTLTEAISEAALDTFNEAIHLPKKK